LWNPAVAAPSWLQGNRRGKFSDDPRSTFFFAERECIDDIAVRVEELTGAANCGRTPRILVSHSDYRKL
jgi:hypothetical protein